MIKPPTIRWEGNPNTISPPDYDIKAPLLPNGSNFPCKGNIKLFDTPEGASVETWQAGSTQIFIINGTSPHDGGTCQVLISEDSGVTFKAIKTFIGGCPVSGKEFSFTVPSETVSGKVIFAWTWFPHTSAAPEMYMDCTAIDISRPGGSGLSNFPDMFVANIGNGCTTPQGSDTVIPNPGGDVETASNSTLKLAPPLGGSACPAVSTFVSSTSSSTTTTSTATSSSTPTTSDVSETTLAAPTSNPTATATPTSAANSLVCVGSITGPVLSVVLLVVFSIYM